MIRKGIATSFTLGKKERLKSRKLIAQIFREGKSVSSFPIKAIFIIQPSENLLQAGFSVSSRSFKKAVDRNRIKRLMREAYRLQKNELEQHLIDTDRQLSVFFIYTGKEIADFTQVSLKLKNALDLLAKNIGRTGAIN